MPFQHVALSTDEAAPNRSLTRRRAYVRYQCGPATPGRIVIQGQEWHRAWVLDLCVTGAGLLVSKTLETGLEIVVHLITGAQPKILEVPAKVRHATQQSDGDWIIGCEFANKLTDDELELLLA